MSGFYDRDPRRGVGLSEFNFDALKTPLLIVHHVKDMCPTNLFGPAQKLTERFPAIVVDGPDETETRPAMRSWHKSLVRQTREGNDRPSIQLDTGQGMVAANSMIGAERKPNLRVQPTPASGRG
jgi:hypothetical protein